MNTACQLDVRELTQRITMHVRIHRVSQWQWRMRLAMLLIRLAAWVGWFNVEIEDDRRIE